MEYYIIFFNTHKAFRMATTVESTATSSSLTLKQPFGVQVIMCTSTTSNPKRFGSRGVLWVEELELSRYGIKNALSHLFTVCCRKIRILSTPI